MSEDTHITPRTRREALYSAVPPAGSVRTRTPRALEHVIFHLAKRFK